MASRQGSKKSIKEMLKKTAGQLEPAELDDILALAIKRPKEYIYKNPDKKFGPAATKKFIGLIRKRKENWPLAYLKGYKEFYSLKFLVNKNVLIPRPESELIVDEVLKNIKKDYKIIDIGTGSGALILSIAKNSPQANYTATDISIKALKTAKTNTRKLKVKNIKFIKSNLLKNVDKEKFDIVVANLPYLKTIQLKEASIKKEPQLALVSGEDGLDHYRKLIKQLPKFLNKKFLILFEIDPDQAANIEEIIKANISKCQIELLSDLANHTRLVKISSK